MSFDIAQLDEFSTGFARALFAAHPEWIEFARVEMADDGETPDLVVEVPSPSSTERERRLFIYTEEFEVTFTYAFNHDHFEWPATDLDIWSNPLSLITAILNEDVGAASAWNDAKWCGSWLIDRGEQISLPDKFPSAKSIRVRSWNGTLDRDLSIG